ncbi:MAG TPA: capsule assembly Wzi family protein [Anaeromyxobacter sp.]|nr:capsule assembly Wzi family protein [Anaeromyxobacter sp.]
MVPPRVHPGFEAEVLPLTSRTYLNTGYPDDRNDAALWQGRGISTELTGGARFRWHALSAAIAPVAAWQQNENFYYPPMTEPGYSPYANPFNYGQIDLPLRFGPSSFWTFDPGQSYVRVDFSWFGAGLSTENLWWGPGTRNSLLMTNSAPGMPHLFAGTNRPVDIWIGWLEAQLLWGRPRESKWFDTDPSDDQRLFTSLNLGYEPRWVPGLFVGLTRVYVYRIPPSGLPARVWLGLPLFNGPWKKGETVSNPSGNVQDNQIFSISLRWVFPESGLEIYGEWGRDDIASNLQDAISQPEHSAAYMFGLQKVFPVGERWLRLVAEMTHTLEVPTNNPPKGVPIFYTHGDERQGYTNDGQMLGAGIGPQADSQFLAIDLFHDRGRTGGWLERVLRNDRWFYDNVHEMNHEDVEVAAGVRGLWSWTTLDLEGSLGFGRRFNMNFGPNATEVKAMLDVTWWPGRESVPALPGGPKRG